MKTSVRLVLVIILLTTGCVRDPDPKDEFTKAVMPSVPSSISNLKVYRALNTDLILVLGFEASKSDLDAILSSRSFHPISYASAGPSVASALKNAESVNIEAIKFTKCYSSFSKDHPYVYYFIIGEDDRHARFLKLGF